jgi:hypothetical protein
LFRGTEYSRNSVPLKRKMLRILFNGTKIEANFRNFVPKHYVEENSVLLLFAGSGIGNFRFESLSQNAAGENFKNSVRKTIFDLRYGPNHFVMIFCQYCKTNFLV